MTEPTEKGAVTPRLREGTRDPFEAVAAESARIRERVAQALEAILPDRAYLKLTLVVDGGRVDRASIVVEVRARPAARRS